MVDFFTRVLADWYTRVRDFFWDSRGIAWDDEEYIWDEGVNDDPITGNWYGRNNNNWYQ